MVRGSICIKYISEVCYTPNPKIRFNELSTMNTDGYRTSVRSGVFVEGGLNTNCTVLSKFVWIDLMFSTRQIYGGNIKETIFELI